MCILFCRRAGLAGAAVIVVALSVAGAGGAMAASCLDEVVQLAKRHAISTDPPTVPPDKPMDVTPRQLGQSGGVIEPPAVDDKSVIRPPADRSAMPTMPDVTRQGPANKDAAADRTSLQAALVAARSEAERGNEKGCREALGRAAQVLERSH